MSAEKNVTTIARGTKITGTIETDNDLVLQGVVQGNVVTSGDIDLDGYVKGDIIAGTADVDNAELRGSLVVEGSAHIGENAAIFGNVSCADLEISGSVKGNIEAKGLCKVKDGAIIAGDLSTYSAEISSGATVQGSLIHLVDNASKDDIDVDGYFAQFAEEGSFLTTAVEGWESTGSQQTYEEPVEAPVEIQKPNEKEESILSKLTDRVEDADPSEEDIFEETENE